MNKLFEHYTKDQILSTYQWLFDTFDVVTDEILVKHSKIYGMISTKELQRLVRAKNG